MIDDKHMNAIREAREKLRELKSIFEKIARAIDDDVILLVERLWWTGIEDDMHVVGIALDAVDQSLDEALGSIADVSGEVELKLAKPKPLPLRLPTREEAFATRRDKAAVLRAQRGDRP